MFSNETMTLSIRNGLLTLAFSVLIVLALAYGFLTFILVTREGWSAVVGQGSLLRLLLETAATPAGGLIGFALIRQAYRKSTAPELFFFSFFIVALAGESLLLAQAWVNFEGLASYFTALVTRIVWAFRFAGLFLLLSASLYSFEFSYRKYGNLVAASVGAGIFLAVLLPLHSSSARNHLLFAVGDTPGMVLVTILLALVVAGNFLLGSQRPGASESAWVRAWAAVSFLTAWSVAIIAGPWGTLLAIPGVILACLNAEQNSLMG